MIDPVVRDDLIRAEEEGRAAALDEQGEALVDEMLKDAEQVGYLLCALPPAGHWLARVVAAIYRRGYASWSPDERRLFVALRDDARVEAEARLRDGAD